MYKMCNFSVIFLLFLPSCAFMPSTGPYASYILKKSSPSLPVVNVDKTLAQSLLKEELFLHNEKIKKNILALITSKKEPIIINPGDVLNLMLWVTTNHENSVLGNVPQPKEMGNYTITSNGKIDLPYINSLKIEGMDLVKAEKIIAFAYKKTELFPKSDATLQFIKNKTQNIVVMGAVNQSKVLNWPDGGMDLSEAIAEAGGFRVFDPTKQGSDLSVNNVVILREKKSYSVPIINALSASIPLQAGDRVILQHTPVVKALCLGAGWKNPTIVPFDELPTLSEVLAGAGDMSINTAQAKAIFVFKRNKQIIYRINFDTIEGMNAARYFPIDNHDIVYVPAARSVTLQQVANIIMSVGYPAATAAAIN